ncbi:YegP family protein [Microbacterium sp. A1-JK]|uniref:YegP family protein n=1 Tax=Microbacterium sp. A1-JK TaxID=3177516 RepID=UPI003885A5A9
MAAILGTVQARVLIQVGDMQPIEVGAIELPVHADVVIPAAAGAPGLEVYERADEKWAWRLRAANGQIIATDGGQGYENREDCDRMAKAVVVGLHAPRGLE